MVRVRDCLVLAVIFALPLLLAPSARATTLYDESVSGDLSNSGSTPTAKTLAVGTNSVIGSVHGTGDTTQDWLALTVPAGDHLTQIILAAYSSTDSQGFTGFNGSATFPGSVNTASNYLGYAHFGTGATNGNLGATNLIGADLLPIMADPNLAQGASGFTSPLGPGTYTFLIQQLGAATSYQFDFKVTAAPEPSSIAIAGTAAICGLGLLRRKRCNG